MISMSELKTSFEKLGFGGVSSYINSGNILFRTKEQDARKLERQIEAMLSRDYQLGSKVVVRSLPEMERLVKSLPRAWGGDAAWRYNVIFLRHSIDSEEVLSELDPKPDIEEVLYRPGTLLWAARVQQVTRTTMVKLSSKKMFQEMTVRNLNTTKKLHDLMSKMAQS